MLTVIAVLKTLIEIAGLALLGQGVLYLLAGPAREQNIFYRVLKTVTAPVWKAVRLLAPRVIVDQHIGYLAFLLLALAWYLLLVTQAAQCLNALSHPSCARLAADYVARCEAGQGEACEVLRRNAPSAAPAR